MESVSFVCYYKDLQANNFVQNEVFDSNNERSLGWCKLLTH